MEITKNILFFRNGSVDGSWNRRVYPAEIVLTPIHNLTKPINQSTTHKGTIPSLLTSPRMLDHYSSELCQVTNYGHFCVAGFQFPLFHYRNGDYLNFQAQKSWPCQGGIQPKYATFLVLSTFLVTIFCVIDIIKEPLYYLDPKQKSYIPITKDIFAHLPERAKL